MRNQAGHTKHVIRERENGLWRLVVGGRSENQTDNHRLEEG